MLLVLDIGNSAIKAALMDGESEVVALLAGPPLSQEEYEKSLRSMLADAKPEGAAICSVVPSLTGAVAAAAKSVTGKEPYVVGPGSPHGLRMGVDNPGEVGVDRIVSASAAASLYGAPVAVVDFGTAVTVDIVGEGGVFLGGSILPGPALMADILSGRTGKLPRVALSAGASAPGADTEGAILSGIIIGTAGAVERLISEAAETTGDGYQVVVTGGYAELFIPHLKLKHSHEPSLTLKGLKIIYEREMA